MPISVAFSRRHWYRKKRLMIPITLLTTVVIAAAIVGSVLGTRSKTNVSRMFFYSFSSSKIDNSPFQLS